MRVLVTGAGGFIGRAVTKRLAAGIAIGGRAVTEVVATDLGVAPAPLPHQLEWVGGDLAARGTVDRLFQRPVDAVIHLASIPGGAAERDYDLARDINVGATESLLHRCREQVAGGGTVPRFVFASSIAVFGVLPALATDDTPASPATTYGRQKLIGELLVEEYSRRGWADGCSLRLPGIVARPPARTGQLSAFLSDMIRELAAGRPFVCPMGPDACAWLMSVPCAVDNLLHGAGATPAALGGRRTFTLPARCASMSDYAGAIGARFGQRADSLVRYQPEPSIEALFGRYPPLEVPAAEAAGFRSDTTLLGLAGRALEA